MRTFFRIFRNICDKVGAYLHVDMAHFSGLVAAEEYPNPLEFADVVTGETLMLDGGFHLNQLASGRR